MLGLGDEPTVLRRRSPIVSPQVARHAESAALALLVLSAFSFANGLWWVIDLTAAFRAHYAAAALALAVVLALGRSRPLAVGCLGLALLHAAMVAPLYLDEPAPPVDGGDELRVMVFNTKHERADQRAVIDYLRPAGPDLVVLFSVSGTWVEAMRDADIPYTIAQSRTSGTSLESMVLARHGTRVSTQLHQLTEGGRGLAIGITTHLDGEPVELLAIHPFSPLTPARARLNEQKLAAATWWAATRDGPHVVLGDLNATPWSPTYRSLMRGTDLIDSQRGFGIQPSWPAKAGPLGLPIDHVLHSPELTTVERRLGPRWGSDHRPLDVTLARAAAH